MPALVSYWKGAILHFPLNQYNLARSLSLHPLHVGELPVDTLLDQPVIVGELDQMSQGGDLAVDGGGRRASLLQLVDEVVDVASLEPLPGHELYG